LAKRVNEETSLDKLFFGEIRVSQKEDNLFSAYLKLTIDIKPGSKEDILNRIKELLKDISENKNVKNS